MLYDIKLSKLKVSQGDTASSAGIVGKRTLEHIMSTNNYEQCSRAMRESGAIFVQYTKEGIADFVARRAAGLV